MTVANAVHTLSLSVAVVLANNSLVAARTGESGIAETFPGNARTLMVAITVTLESQAAIPP